MTFSRPLLYSCMLFLAGSAAAADGPRLSIDRLYSLPSIIGTAPGDFAWSPDGRRLAFLWNDRGYPFRDVWVLDTLDQDLEAQRWSFMPAPEAESPREPENALTEAREQERRELDTGVTEVTWHPDGRHLLVSFAGDLWSLADGLAAVRLTRTETTETAAVWAPHGRTLTFLRQGDIWALVGGEATAEMEPRQLTNLAREAVQVGDFRWSPDGSRLALLEMDRSRVAVRGIPDYLAEETELVEIRRAYPGEEAVGYRLGVLEEPDSPAVASEVRWLAWPETPPDMILGYRWSADGRLLAIDTCDLYAKDRRIYVVEVGPTGDLEPQLLVHEQDPENETFYFWRIDWSTDSRLLYFLSDRVDDYHVWAVSPYGKDPPRQLTSGSWAVAEIHPVDGGLIVVGNRDRAEERHLFRIPDRGGEAVRLSQRPGTHTPTVSPDGRHAAVHFSSQSTPPDLFLTSLTQPSGSATAERRVTHSPLPEFSDYRWAEAEFVTFPSHVDGSTLHGRLMLPPDFDPARRYPAILGSVYTDSVRNQWGGRTAHPTWGLDQVLSQEGYILLNVDMRGSWGRGREHRRGIRLDYGGMDIEDLESGVRFLGTLGYVDMEHIGIWGSSYGGLMTTMSLFRKPHLYAAGIAGAPATNVRHALSGQMAVMMRPQDEPAAYDDSSPYLHAAGLEDPLMIIHGMRDRIVLFKDSVELVQRLILLDKDVEFVVLPNAGHGWDNEGLAQTRFAFRKMVEFFHRHLGAP